MSEKLEITEAYTYEGILNSQEISESLSLKLISQTPCLQEWNEKDIFYFARKFNQVSKELEEKGNEIKTFQNKVIADLLRESKKRVTLVGGAAEAMLKFDHEVYGHLGISRHALVAGVTHFAVQELTSIFQNPLSEEEKENAVIYARYLASLQTFFFPFATSTTLAAAFPDSRGLRENDFAIIIRTSENDLKKKQAQILIEKGSSPVIQTGPENSKFMVGKLEDF